jgi:tetratricopeptide (TPR) repeat protein
VGAALHQSPTPVVSTPPIKPAMPPGNAPERSHEARVKWYFERGVILLHARRFDYAAVAFHEVLRLAPRLPEAHVNMGFSLLGQARPDAARDFFLSALALNPRQANAYYGLGEANEALGDMQAALGAMRTFVHLVRSDDPFVRKARAALWEWQSPPAESAADAEGVAE